MSMMFLGFYKDLFGLKKKEEEGAEKKDAQI